MEPAVQPEVQALAELRDIHLPPEPAFWPPAPGWWLLAMALAAGVVMLHRYLRARELRSRPRRVALSAIARLRARHANGEPAANLIKEVAILLRQVALSRYPRKRVAGLAGYRWLEFLDSTANVQGFVDGPGACLMSAPYTRDARADLPALLALAEDWVRQNV